MNINIKINNLNICIMEKNIIRKLNDWKKIWIWSNCGKNISYYE